MLLILNVSIKPGYKACVCPLVYQYATLIHETYLFIHERKNMPDALFFYCFYRFIRLYLYMKHRMLFILFCLFPIINLQVKAGDEALLSPEYSYRRYTTQDGLPQMLTECIYQDSRGFIWVGTMGGFARFDGLSFKPYLRGRQENIILMDENSKKEVRGIHFRRIHTVDTVTDNIDTRLIASDDLFINIYLSRMLPPGYAVFETADEKNRAIYHITDEGLEPVLTTPLLNEMDACHKVYWSNNRETFFLPTYNGVYVLNRSGGETAFYKENSFFSLIELGAELYAFGNDGVYKLAGTSFIRIADYAFQASDFGIAVCINQQGHIVLADESSLYRYYHNRLEKISGNMNMIRNLAIDNEGNLWVATYQGLYNFFHLNFKNYSLRNGNDLARSLVFDNNSSIWVGTLDGDLFNIKGEQTVQIKYPPGQFKAPGGKSVYTFFSHPVETGGAIYKTGYGDVLCVQEGRPRWLYLPMQYYQYLQADNNGHLIAGTRRNLLVCSTNGEIVRNIELPHAGYCVEADAENNLWIGTSNGILLFKGDSLTHMPDVEGLTSCMNMTKDSDYTIWMSSENRLYKSAGDSVLFIRRFEDAIRSLHATRNNQLIVATISGFYMLDKTGNNPVFFNQYNGYTGIEPLNAHITEDAEGNICLASVNNFTLFNPVDLLYNYRPPQLNMLHVASSTDNIHWQNKLPETRELDYSHKNLRFQYIGLSYSATENVTYRYRLTGFQEEWSPPIKEREVTFNNLPPGDYEFQIKAGIGTDMFDETLLVYPVVIVPAFWQTIQFQFVAVILLLAVIVFLIYTYIKRKNEKQLRELNRELQLNELHLQSIRLKSIPHFNSNVLAGIEYYIMNYSKEETNKYLNRYSQFTNITLKELDKPARSLQEELVYVELYLSLEKFRFQDEFSYGIAVDVNVDKRILVPNMVLHTYCENAMKHGIRNKKSPGHIDIMIETYPDGIVLKVEDNGVGREKAATMKTHSTKMGLSILLQQITLFNERNKKQITQQIIDLKDSAGNATGTRFELYVPEVFNYF